MFVSSKLTERLFQEIETTLSCKFDPSQDTLATLEQLNAFQFAEELEEISGKASSEANLETMLRKVIFLSLHIFYLLQCVAGVNNLLFKVLAHFNCAGNEPKIVYQC